MAEELADEHCATTEPPDEVSTRVMLPADVGECEGVDPLPLVEDPEPSL